MVNTTGLTGAAPVWSQFMQYAEPIVSGGSPTPFVIPAGITERIICAVSGAEPSQWCKGGQRSEFYAADQPPLPAGKDLWRQVKLDTWTGLEASAACKDFIEEQMVMNVSDPWARNWLRTDDGRGWLEGHDFPRRVFFAPDRECAESDPHPVLEFNNLSEGQVITAPSLSIKAAIEVKNGGRVAYGRAG